jgi:lipopolysaccharide transport system permease protein
VAAVITTRRTAGLSLLWRQRGLVWAMAKRELVDRYAGQMLGSFWAIAHPLLLMAVYLFVFGYVLRVRVGGTAEMPRDYTVYLLSGIVPWLALSEALNKASVAVTSNANLVKQVVFPLEVLPVKGVVASILTQFTGLAVLTIYILVTDRSLPATYALVPVALALQVVTMTGLALVLASVGVFVRDLKDIVQVVTLVGAYLVPVFYLPAMVPESFRPLLYLNPFTYLIWCWQDVCYYGRIEHPAAWLVATAIAMAVFTVGWRMFRRLKPLFGNAL